MIGLVVGGVIGWLRPDWGNAVFFLRDIFINLIKSIIAPLVFSTIVVGIAGAGALRKVGRMGAKALIYFEIVTTAALFIGLAVVNFTKPGVGVILTAPNTDIIKQIGQAHPKTMVETIVHAFPASVVEAMVHGDVLQIVTFSVIFALAVAAALGALDAYATEGVLENVEIVGSRMRAGLAEVAERSRGLTRVRGLGMVAAVDLCASDGGPLDPAARTGNRVFREAVRRGVLLRPLGDTLYLFPPLNCSAPEVDQMVQVLSDSVAAVTGRP